MVLENNEDYQHVGVSSSVTTSQNNSIIDSDQCSMLEELTSMSQKLRRVLLLVGVLESGMLVTIMEVPPTVWVKVMGDGLFLKTREPLRCLGMSFTSFMSGKGITEPEHI